MLERAAGRTRRQIEELLAEIAPRPDVPAVMRRLPTRAAEVRPEFVSQSGGEPCPPLSPGASGTGIAPLLPLPQACCWSPLLNSVQTELLQVLLQVRPRCSSPSRPPGTRSSSRRALRSARSWSGCRRSCPTATCGRDRASRHGEARPARGSSIRPVDGSEGQADRLLSVLALRTGGHPAGRDGARRTPVSLPGRAGTPVSDVVGSSTTIECPTASAETEVSRTSPWCVPRTTSIWPTATTDEQRCHGTGDRKGLQRKITDDLAH